MRVGELKGTHWNHSKDIQYLSSNCGYESRVALIQVRLIYPQKYLHKGWVYEGFIQTLQNAIDEKLATLP